MTTNMQAGNLCSRDNASRDHAFPSHILKMPQGKRCISALTTFISKPKWDMKASLDSQYAIIGIISTV